MIDENKIQNLIDLINNKEEKANLTNDQREYFRLEEYFGGQLRIGKQPNDIASSDINLKTLSSSKDSEDVFLEKLQKDIAANAFFNACYRYGFTDQIILGKESFYAGSTLLRYKGNLSEFTIRNLTNFIERSHLESLREKVKQNSPIKYK